MLPRGPTVITRCRVLEVTSKCVIHSEAAIDMILAQDKNTACQNRYVL